MLLLIFKFTVALLVIFAFGVGIYSLYRNPKSKVIWLWSITSFATGAWALGLFLSINTTNELTALHYNVFMAITSVLVPAFYFNFISSFLYQEKKLKWIIILGYLVCSSILGLVIVNPGLFVGGVSPTFHFDFWVVSGPLFNLYASFFWVYVLAGIYLLFRHYFKEEGIMKEKIRYVLIASIIGIFGAGTAFLPQLFGIYPFAVFVAFVYPIVITYGIFLKND